MKLSHCIRYCRILTNAPLLVVVSSIINMPPSNMYSSLPKNHCFVLELRNHVHVLIFITLISGVTMIRFGRVVIYCVGSRSLFKLTFFHDGLPRIFTLPMINVLHLPCANLTSKALYEYLNLFHRCRIKRYSCILRV